MKKILKKMKYTTKTKSTGTSRSKAGRMWRNKKTAYTKSQNETDVTEDWENFRSKNSGT
jgi:hypothetical protein